MENYKQLTSEIRYQIYGLKQAGLKQTDIAKKDWRQQINDISRVQYPANQAVTAGVMCSVVSSGTITLVST